MTLSVVAPNITIICNEDGCDAEQTVAPLEWETQMPPDVGIVDMSTITAATKARWFSHDVGWVTSINENNYYDYCPDHAPA